MKLLIIIIIALFCSVGVALLVREDPGYVLVTVGPWTVETSVAVLVVGLAVVYFLAYKLTRYLAQAWALPRTAKRFRERRRVRKAHELMTDGLARLTAGEFRSAERKLAKAASYDARPTVSLLGAARAAEALGDYPRRDHYLSQASRLSEGGGGTAVALTRAEFEINHGERDKALKELSQLRANLPRNPQVLARLKTLYLELQDWEALQAMLPDLKKRGGLEDSAYRELEHRVVLERFSQRARNADLDTLHRLWKEVPRHLRSDPELLVEYATQLETQNAGAEAEKLLRKAILSAWQPRLVLAYGEISRCDSQLQLRNAESWLRGRERDSRLLLTLGRIARRNHLWDKARNYLEASVAARPSPDACQELGSLLEQLDQPEAAKLSYRRGLQLLTGKEVVSTTPVLEAPAAAAASTEGKSEEAPAEPPAGREAGAVAAKQV